MRAYHGSLMCVFGRVHIYAPLYTQFVCQNNYCFFEVILEVFGDFLNNKNCSLIILLKRGICINKLYFRL